jgi:hypothetical protein
MKKILSLFLLFIAILATSWALVHPQLFFVHDFVHGARIAEMLRGLQDGHVPVRWSSNFGFGYGMPLFEFYAPLPYYVGAGVYWLSGDLVLSVKMLYLICAGLSFWGMYLCASRLYGRAGGWLSAFAFTLAPYRAVNLFVRGAVAEAWGMMAIPWVLLGIVMVIRKEKGGWLMLVVSLLTLFLSHNLTTLLFFPISALFGFGYWVIHEYHHDRFLHLQAAVRSVLTLIASYALAIGGAAFYLFPALLEKDLTKVNAIFSDYFRYSIHYLYIRQFFIPYWGYGGSEFGPNDGISFFLGFGQLFGLIMLFFLVLSWFFRRKNKKNHGYFSHLWMVVLFFFLLLISMFMTLEKSHWIWDSLPFMAVVQFPWRWLSITATMLALLVGAGTWFIRVPTLRYAYAGALSLFIIATNAWYFHPDRYLDSSDSFYYADAGRIRHDMSKILNDYIPAQMQLSENKELAPIDVPYTVVNGDAREAQIVDNSVQEKLVSTLFSQPATIEFSIADFPGWTTYVDGKEVAKKETSLGNISVDVPAGGHLVGVQFHDSPVRWWSDVFSVTSLGVLLLILISTNTVFIQGRKGQE